MSEFKQGDRVVCTKSYAGFKEGEEYTLLERYNYDGWDCEHPDYYINDRYLNECWKKVKSYTWTSKFNIGDKVTINGRTSNFVIQKISFTNDKLYYSGSYTLSYPEGELSLYEKPEVKELSVKEISDLLGYEVKVVK